MKFYNILKNRIKADTGKLVEHTKVDELSMLKELGKLTL